MQQLHKIFLLGVHNLNIMAAKVPTHVPTSWGPSVTVGALAFTYHACSLPLKILALLGIGIFRGYLLVLDSNVLYTPHALSLIRPYIYTGFNTCIPGPLTWPINLTWPPNWHAPHRCQCPITWALSSALWSSSNFICKVTCVIFLYYKI